MTCWGDNRCRWDERRKDGRWTRWTKIHRAVLRRLECAGAGRARSVDVPVVAVASTSRAQLVSMMETLDNLHDVTLRARNAGGQTESIHLHRVVLVVAIPYAKAMVKDAWKGQWRRCGCLWW